MSRHTAHSRVVGFAGWARVAAVVAARPSLWPAASRQARRLARRGWWRRAPFLPVPGGAYLAFRAETQYGDPLHPPVPADVVNYLAWCQEMERLA